MKKKMIYKTETHGHASLRKPKFSAKGDEFIINQARLPRHWYNYLWNKNYVSLFSHLADGYSLSQDKMGNRIDLVSKRMLFIRDKNTKEYWSANGLPISDGKFEAIHGLGYSIINLQRNEIKSSFRIYVPETERLEIWSLTLENLASEAKNLQVFPYIDSLVDGANKAQNYYMSKAYFDSENNVAIIDSESAFDDLARSYNWLGSSTKPEHYDTRQSAFIGYGTFQAPDALEFGKCQDSEAEMAKPILALETHINLKANETKTIHFFVGTALSKEEIHDIKAKYFTTDNINYEFTKLKQSIAQELGQTSFRTNNHDLDSFLNYWLKRQISLGVQWARVRHNGYRDLMQDIASFSFINPKIALEQFKRVLAYQHSDGHAPRTFLNGEILDKDFSDNHVWIIYAAYNLVLETADLNILRQVVDFNDGTSASIYIHLLRALDYLWKDRAEHGLCKIRSGDWNDALDKLGSKGKGESVWLTMAFLRALRQFAELSELKKEKQILKQINHRIKKIEIALDFAKEDNYFIRAIDDDAGLLGSKTNTEASFFLNSQTWAVLSQKVVGDEARKLLELSEEKLMTDIGILSVENAFTSYNPKIALMSRKSKGIQENGGVYLHASAFKLVADAIAKRCDAVEKGIADMLPFAKDGEPFVFSNCYYAIENSYRYGQSGQSWATGTAAWFYYAMLNYVFGIKPTIQGLRLEPCLPKSWNNVSVKRIFRNKTYNINYWQLLGSKELKIIVDGEENKSNILPFDERNEYNVEVIISNEGDL